MEDGRAKSLQKTTAASPTFSPSGEMTLDVPILSTDVDRFGDDGELAPELLGFEVVDGSGKD